MDPLHDPLVKKINQICWKIWKKVGAGFDEKFYKQALIMELTDAGLNIEREKYIPAFYDDVLISRKFLDLFVENRIIIEAKSTNALIPRDYSQLRSYLKATNLPYGILVNFGTSPLQFKIGYRELKRSSKSSDYKF